MIAIENRHFYEVLSRILSAMDFTLDRIYRVNEPHQVRRAPMAVICCGMPRTGSMSLTKALKVLGYQTVFHGSLLPAHPDISAALVEAARLQADKDPRINEASFWDCILGEYEAITDLPATKYVQELAAAYPNARIVLNTREAEDWMQSMQEALAFYLQGRRYFELFDKAAYWMRRYIETNFDPMFDWNFKLNAKQVYETHLVMVRQEIPSERLLEWRVEDGWESLCKSLNQPVPDIPFPTSNAVADIQSRLDVKIRMLRRKAQARILAFVIVISAGTALMVGRRWG